MKRLNSLLLLAALLLFCFAANAAVVNVVADISVNKTWSKNNIYIIKGKIRVKDGAILTIQPGTLIKGDKPTQGTLIISKGSKIIAEGGAANPIIFTSNQPAGSRAAGDWGGLILLGKAPINVPGGSAQIEGLAADPLHTYGGNDAADNSGSLKYVRIEYAGIALTPNNEINGLTFGGVGSGTSVDYVQVSYCGDDSFEWFGGTVNCKHLISIRPVDDDFDTDFGYSGKLQFLVAQREPNVADVSTSRGFEADNDASGSSNSPISNPTFSNVTLVGPAELTNSSFSSQYGAGAHLRRNTRLDTYNSIVMGWPQGLNIDGASTAANANSGELNWENNLVAGIVGNPANNYVTNQSSFDIDAFAVAEGGNTAHTTNNQVILRDPFDIAVPRWQPNGLTSPALNTAAFTSSNLSDPFFKVVTYRGAFAALDLWSQCWTEFSPNSLPYTASNDVQSVPTVTINASGTVSVCPAVGQFVFTASSNDAGATYQWYRNDVPVNGATSSSYTATAAGRYRVVVESSNSCGRASANVTLRFVQSACFGEGNEEQALIVNDNTDAAVQVAPNPFSGFTTLTVDLKDDSDVQVEMYDASGRLVMLAYDGWMTGGLNSVELNGADLAQGMYLVKVVASGQLVKTLQIIHE